MLSQVAQFAPMFNVIVEDASVDLRTTFDSTAKYRLSEAPTEFEGVEFRLSIRSPSPQEHIRELLEHAKTGCHASQSFSKPVPVTVIARVNGQEI